MSNESEVKIMTVKNIVKNAMRRAGVTHISNVDEEQLISLFSDMLSELLKCSDFRKEVEKIVNN